MKTAPPVAVEKSVMSIISLLGLDLHLVTDSSGQHAPRRLRKGSPA